MEAKLLNVCYRTTQEMGGPAPKTQLMTKATAYFLCVLQHYPDINELHMLQLL